MSARVIFCKKKNCIENGIGGQNFILATNFAQKNGQYQFIVGILELTNFPQNDNGFFLDFGMAKNLFS